LPSYDRTDRCFYLINREEESSKVSSVVSVSKPDYVEKMPFKPLPPEGECKKSKKKKKNKKKKKKKRSKRQEETVSSTKHVAPIIDYDNSNLDDVPMHVTYVRGLNSHVDSTGGNLVLAMANPILTMFICPNQSKRNLLAHLSATLQRNLGGRPRGGCWLGFHPRTGFEGPDATQSMHVDLTCVCMCVGGLRDAIDIAPRQL
jgi:hypothetical protein